MPRPLTPDETHILTLASQGYSAHDIAYRSGVDVRIVRNAIARVRRALGARDLHHAIQIHNTRPDTTR